MNDQATTLRTLLHTMLVGREKLVYIDDLEPMTAANALQTLGDDMLSQRVRSTYVTETGRIIVTLRDFTLKRNSINLPLHALLAAFDDPGVCLDIYYDEDDVSAMITVTAFEAQLLLRDDILNAPVEKIFRIKSGALSIILGGLNADALDDR